MMKLLDNLFPKTQTLSDEAPGWNLFYSLISGRTQSAAGIGINAQSAMRQSTVMACVRVLAETLAQLPKVVYKTTANKRRTTDSDHPLNVIFGEAPNSWQTPFEFVEMLQGHVALRGNAYALRQPGNLGSVTQLIPLDPDKMKVQRLQNYSLNYKYTLPDGTEKTFTQDQIFHLRGLTTDGLVGISPLATARDTFGNALAQERYQGKQFSTAIKPSGYLKGPPALRQQDAKLMQQSLMEAYSGEDNWGKPMVTWGGVEWEQMGMTNLDAQFLDQMKFSANEICKVFRMPPHMVGILERATNNNIEHQSLEFVLYTILPWVRRWEEAIQRDLITDSSNYLKFNLRGLMRGDNATRSDYYQKMVFSGLMSPNEVRELEDLDPYEGGDEFFMQSAMTTVDQIVNPPPPPKALPVAQPDDWDTSLPEEGEQPDNKGSGGPPPQASQKSPAKMAVEFGKIRGENEIYKIQLQQRMAELAVRDQQVAEAKELAADAAAELSKRSFEFTLSNSELKKAANEAKINAAVKVTEAEDTVKVLTAKSAEAERAIEALRAESESSSAKIKAALDDNSRLLVACSKRMLAMEVDGVLRMLNKKNGIAGLESFYEKHSARMTAAMEPLIGQRGLLCESISCDEFVSQHIADSKALLLEAFKGPAEGAQERMKESLAAWGQRADAILAKLSKVIALVNGTTGFSSHAEGELLIGKESANAVPETSEG